jgi:trehalose 6-phosphate phosphatase
VRYLLAPAQQVLLDRVARPGTLLAFDFDGTLAPLVRDRRRARMARSTRALLAELSRHRRCAVISGRGRDDVASRCAGIPLAAIIGNHGLEPSPGLARFTGTGERWTRALRRALGKEPGIDVENKHFTVSLHYALAPSKARARRVIAAAALALDGAQLVHGVNVVNLIPAGAPDKADALRWLKRRLGCPRSLFVGDDITDEAVFAIGDDGRDVGVRVGRAAHTLARYYLRRQSQIDQLLAELLRRVSPRGSGNGARGAGVRSRAGSR